MRAYDGELPWFRLYCEYATDPLVQMLAFEDQRHFVMAMCMKCKGVLDKDYPSPEVRARVISAFLGLDRIAADEANRRLREMGLVDENWHPVNWEKRQFPSDSSTSRVKAYRARKERQAAAERGNGDETFQERFSNGLDTDTDTDTESESDDPRSAPPRVRGRQTRAERLPNDWELTKERRLVAEAEKLPAERTFEKFRDYWASASGARARKHDWDATWRNWCKTEADRARPPPGMPAGPGRPGGAGTYTASIEELDSAALGRLKARRAALGLPDFRDPLPRESANDYRKAQDEAWERKRDQDMQRSKRTQLDAIAAAGDALRKVKA